MAAYRSFHSAHSEEERRKWQNPEAILSGIDVKPGSTFLDIGCGSGFFTIPAAKLVGESGRVYGLDIDREAISRIRQKAESEGLRNLHLEVGKAEEIVLCQACADIVFFGIVLHDFAGPARVLVNARTMLKPDGRLVDLDWKKESMDFGPPLRIRFNEAEAVQLIEAAGFKIDSVGDNGRYHYLIIAKPVPPKA